MLENNQPPRIGQAGASDGEVLKRVRAELASVRKERQTYIQAADRQIAAFDGAIQALEIILNGGKATPIPPTEPTKEGAK